MKNLKRYAIAPPTSVTHPVSGDYKVIASGNGGGCVKITHRQSPGRADFGRPDGTAASHPQAILKPPRSHPQAIWWPTGRHPEATLRLPRSHPRATPKPPSGYPEATLRLPRGYPKATRNPTYSPRTAFRTPHSAFPNASQAEINLLLPLEDSRESGVRVRFLLGPAGSGKTFRCLAGIREALAVSQEGPPLLLVAPKQTTYQLERQFLADDSIPGYTRLHILSFERLAHFVFDQLGRKSPRMLDEGGRLMVLRGLLARKRDELKLFRASARLTGFAQHLSLVLGELQRNQQTPELLRALAGQMQEERGLSYKLQDLATMLAEYLAWLKAHELQDADCLLAEAAAALGGRSKSEGRGPKVQEHRPVSSGNPAIGDEQPALRIDGLWVDGLAEISGPELDLLAALVPCCREATVTFCLERVPTEKLSWLSNWSVVQKTFEECKKRLGSLPDVSVSLEVLARGPGETRFVKNPVLAHLEEYWAAPQPYRSATEEVRGEVRSGTFGPRPSDFGFSSSALRVAVCANPEAEVTLAAREVLRYARAGGRFREVTVLVRSLVAYHEPLQRVFSRYGIPFFLDRRESVSHHPLAELTRSALRTVAFHWQSDDWFAVLKTGLVPADDSDIDRLENEALARGWKGSVWQKPLAVASDPELTAWLAELIRRILPPFQRLALDMGACQNKPTGPQLAAALRGLWGMLNVEERLQEWAGGEGSGSDLSGLGRVHQTVWSQMNKWLESIELGFPAEALALREWLPILDAGLAGLTVGVIPPALDQVLIGAIDRSRNPDIKLALVLGLNETVFPAPPETSALLTETDRRELEKRGVFVGPTARQHLGRERYYAYIACTRARERLVLTSALHDANGSPLNPSPFLSQVRQLFPSLPIETVPRSFDWRESEHAVELIPPLLAVQRSSSVAARQPSAGREEARPATSVGATDDAAAVSSQLSPIVLPESLASLPSLASVVERLRHFQSPLPEESLAPELATQLYGSSLHTSVSRMEQFAACPFKFFVQSGLRAEERQLFELDKREQGTFQHDALALFHTDLRRENKWWRDITPEEARERMGRIAQSLIASYRDGLLQASEESRFMARVLTESLQDFIETLVGWMREQYHFDPIQVELPFGEGEGSPAWVVGLGDGQQLELYGRIDRVDVCADPDSDAGLCVVVDYKSSPKQVDPLLLAHGLQLQLLAYLNVLRRWPAPVPLFGFERLVPAGVFYVSLRGKYGQESNRVAALADAGETRKRAYRHTGRFDVRSLRLLDARPNAQQGDQFNYRLTKSGEVYKSSIEAMPPEAFLALLDSVEANLRRMGKEILSGQVKLDPYRKGSTTACDQCEYASICRIDPWTQNFRVLRKPEAEAKP